MPLARAAVCPATPLLVPEVSVTDAGLTGIRSAVSAAVHRLLRGVDAVTVVGPAETTGEQPGCWDWSALGLPPRPTATPLPIGLGVGAWLLDEAGWRGPRRYWSVAPGEPPGGCRDLGERLAGGVERLGLLVLADGSARRSEQAPGHLDTRAETYDLSVAAALATCDLAALAGLPVGLSAALMAGGRAALQVLAGSARGRALPAELLALEDPFGVAWFAACWGEA